MFKDIAQATRSTKRVVDRPEVFWLSVRLSPNFCLWREPLYLKCFFLDKVIKFPFSLLTPVNWMSKLKGMPCTCKRQAVRYFDHYR